MGWKRFIYNVKVSPRKKSIQIKKKTVLIPRPLWNAGAGSITQKIYTITSFVYEAGVIESLLAVHKCSSGLFDVMTP